MTAVIPRVPATDQLHARERQFRGEGYYKTSRFGIGNEKEAQFQCFAIVQSRV